MASFRLFDKLTTQEQQRLLNAIYDVLDANKWPTLHSKIQNVHIPDGKESEEEDSIPICCTG